MEEKTYNCVIILGPTAVGKTALGVRYAREHGGEIISADSRQVYRGLDIGSGKDLSDYDVQTESGTVHVPYHLIDVATLSEEYNVYSYQTDFYRVFADLQKRGVLPVIVGGTGMYVDAIVRGYDFIEVKENAELRAKAAKMSLEELGEWLLRLKPNLHNKSDLLIRERTIRAIEIAEFMQSDECAELRKSYPPRPTVQPLIIGTTLERTALRSNITKRLRERFAAGMIDEVKHLHDVDGYSYERLERLGLEYRFISEFLEGKIASEEVLFTKLNTAIGQFAKRQETWFRGMQKKGVNIHWLPCILDVHKRYDALLEISASMQLQLLQP